MNFIAPAFPSLEFFLSLGKSLGNIHANFIQHKVHDYRQYTAGIDYALERVEEENEIKFYLSGEGTGIRSGDYFIFSENLENCYQVEQIEYYSNPCDRWIALLKVVTNQTEKS